MLAATSFSTRVRLRYHVGRFRSMRCRSAGTRLQSVIYLWDLGASSSGRGWPALCELPVVLVDLLGLTETGIETCVLQDRVTAGPAAGRARATMSNLLAKREGHHVTAVLAPDLKKRILKSQPRHG